MHCNLSCTLQGMERWHLAVSSVFFRQWWRSLHARLLMLQSPKAANNCTPGRASDSMGWPCMASLWYIKPAAGQAGPWQLNRHVGITCLSCHVMSCLPNDTPCSPMWRQSSHQHASIPFRTRPCAKARLRWGNATDHPQLCIAVQNA